MTNPTDALAQQYAQWVQTMHAQPDMTLEATRELFSHWGDVTAEPDDVIYEPVDVDGLNGLWVSPEGATTERTLLCSHGGGYVVGSIHTHRKMFGHIAKAVGCRALVVDYRLAPESPHPGPVNDMTRAYRWLLDQGIAPEHIAFVGDSAGGALALTNIANARAQGLPLPVATLPISPWAGWDTSGASYDSNAHNDALVSRDTTNGMGSLFIANGDPKDPLANPLHTDYTGFPPIYLTVGGHETLLDDSRRIAERAKAAGAEVRLDIYPEQQHVFQMMAGNSAVADQAIADMAKWLRPRFGL